MSFLPLRLGYVLAQALVRPRLEPLAESRLALQVLPSDLDLYLHVNNGRYLTLMDLGRTDLVLRNGLGRVFLNTGWRPLVAAATVKFRRSLKPFERFTLVTRTLCWNEKSLFLEQVFERKGGVAARALVRIVVRGGGETIPPAKVMEALGASPLSPPMPDELRSWQEATGYG